MSQVDLVANGDLDGVTAIYAEDICFTMTGFPPEPLHLSGADAVQGWVSEQLADNMRIDVTVTSAEENMVKTTVLSPIHWRPWVWSSSTVMRCMFLRRVY